MSSKKLNKQNAAILYRKWFVTGNKNPKSNYDKEQVDELTQFHIKEYEGLISSLKNEDNRIFRLTFEILFIKSNSIATISNEVLIIGDVFQSLNLPGCASFGIDFMDAIKNYFNAVIECLDARFKNGMKPMNSVHTMKFYERNSNDKTYKEVVQMIKECGWSKKYSGTYNDIYLKSGDKVSFTIPKVPVIPSVLVFWYYKHLFQISARQYYENERDMDLW